MNISIKTIWKNKWHILKGIKNFFFKKDSIEKIAADRAEICGACPKIDLTGEKCMMPGTQPCCGICGCSLELKLRDLTSQCADDNNPLWLAVKQ